MRWVTALDLHRWAERLDSESMLPELVRRLVHATTVGVDRISFQSGESIQTAGWDGVVHVTAGNEYVPNDWSGCTASNVHSSRTFSTEPSRHCLVDPHERRHTTLRPPVMRGILDKQSLLGQRVIRALHVPLPVRRAIPLAGHVLAYSSPESVLDAAPRLVEAQRFPPPFKDRRHDKRHVTQQSRSPSTTMPKVNGRCGPARRREPIAPTPSPT